MAVLVEAISVVMRADRLLRAFDGDWEQFKAIVPNSTLCADGELVRLGFMAPDDARSWIEQLSEFGLRYTWEGKAQDLTVCDQLGGFTTPTEWAEFGHVILDSDPDQRVAACQLVGSKISQVVTPDGWQWENSLTRSYLFATGEEGGDAMRKVGESDGLEVWKSPLSEKPLFLGRTARPDDGGRG